MISFVSERILNLGPLAITNTLLDTLSVDILIIAVVLILGYIYSANESEAMKTCQLTHSAAVCYNELAR